MHRLLYLLLALGMSTATALAQQNRLSSYNIRWQTPGLNAQGSVPLGNGDIGINAWVETNGDLVFYVSKTDAWSENGQLMKLGMVRISLYPALHLSKSFSQELVLENGQLIIETDNTKLSVWVDAHHPIIQVDIDSKHPVKAVVTLHNWRKNRQEVTGTATSALYGLREQTADKRFTPPAYIEPDTVLPAASNRIWSCHYNAYSVWKDNLNLQALGTFTQTATDPLLYRTFGIAIEGHQFASDSDTTLVSKIASGRLQVNVYPLTRMGSVDNWKKEISKQADSISQIDSSARRAAHHQWWKRFWNQHYIYITTRDSLSGKQAFSVTQGYILQRFINACGGRGNAPIKFNGSIFTVDTYSRKGANAGLNADFRAWGGPYWWQNTRLPYWTMLIAGDFEMMKPLFNMYMNALPLRKLATHTYYQHDGAFYPETMNFWGAYTNVNYGTRRENLPHGHITNNYIRNYWSGGLELSLMMLDYYDFTQSKDFAQDTLVPFVSEILTFFNQHWPRDEKGKILFSPAIALETYHTAVNPLPEIAGIRKVAQKMLSLPALYLTTDKKNICRQLLHDVPEIPLRIIKNDTLLAPAFTYSNKQNTENPELYAIFPYRIFGIGKPGLDMACKTFDYRLHKENGGWQQNAIQAACLGRTIEAKQMVIESFTTWDKNFRFPAFWGPNYDWTPDQDHGSVAMNALQRMLVQYESGEVILFPAWPADWDVEFRLSGPSATIIEGSLQNGRLLRKIIKPNNVKVHLSAFE